jgi:diacylglycerol O-acyltransferase
MTDDAPSEWGRSTRLSAFDTLTWRIEADPRLRSTITIIDILDRAPAWDRLVAAHDWGTRLVPRFRQRVVEPALPIGPAEWVVDANFDLTYHLRRVRLPGPGTMRQLLDLAGQLAMTPFDRARPPWEAILVEDLEGGRAGYILKLHHSATDGLGGIQLLSQLHSRTPEPTPDKPQPPPPAPRQVSPAGLLGAELARQVRDAPVAAARGVGVAVVVARRALGRPERAAGEALRLARSAQRVLTPPPAPRSPLLSGRSLTWRFEVHEVPLADLKAAGKAAGGSVNDAFLAALLGAFRHYHEHFGVEIDKLPIAIPISLRATDDPMGGNRFAGARLAAPVGEPDPRERIRRVREFVLSARDEPAIDALSVLAPVLSRLPTDMLIRLISQYARGHDLQASNVPGIAHPVYLAGARITHMFPLGPVPGCAAMAAMVSHNGICCIGVNLDPSAITEPDVFASCLRAGFDEVLALAGEPAQPSAAGPLELL